MNGPGIYQNANKDIFVGFFENNKREGFGLYRAKDRNLYKKYTNGNVIDGGSIAEGGSIEIWGLREDVETIKSLQNINFEAGSADLETLQTIIRTYYSVFSDTKQIINDFLKKPDKSKLDKILEVLERGLKEATDKEEVRKQQVLGVVKEVTEKLKKVEKELKAERQLIEIDKIKKAIEEEIKKTAEEKVEIEEEIKKTAEEKVETAEEKVETAKMFEEVKGKSLKKAELLQRRGELAIVAGVLIGVGVVLGGPAVVATAATVMFLQIASVVSVVLLGSGLLAVGLSGFKKIYAKQNLQKAREKLENAKQDLKNAKQDLKNATEDQIIVKKPIPNTITTTNQPGVNINQ